MSCECGNKGNCGCGSGFSSEGLQSQQFEASVYPQYKESSSSRNCQSNKGRFYDLTLEDFIVPEVGREAYLKVCDGSLWKAQQFIAISLSGSKIAAFKITEVGTGRLKVLNGCDKSGDNPILGNPDKGYNIPAKSVMYPIAPVGCDTGFALQVVTVLKTQGTDALLEILADSPDICFTSVAAAGEDERVHLFGGTQPDCECAPDASVSSCLRKIIKIFTGQGGRTLCMPEVATISLASSEERRIAVFDENDCVKKGPTYSDLKSCDNANPIGKNVSFNALNGCQDGITVGLTPSEKYLEVTTEEVDDPDSDDEDDKVIRWVSKEKRYAIIEHSTGGGSGGGSAVHGSWLIRPLSNIVKQSTSFVTLASNIFTIKKPGIYKIDFFGVFFATDDSQVRLENSTDGTEIYYGNSAYARFITNATDAQNSISVGSAIVEVATEKSFKMMYRTDLSYNTGLGHPNAWGPNVYASVCITSL